MVDSIPCSSSTLNLSSAVFAKPVHYSATAVEGAGSKIELVSISATESFSGVARSFLHKSHAIIGCPF
jgi:hypothetical protein